VALSLQAFVELEVVVLMISWGGIFLILAGRSMPAFHPNILRIATALRLLRSGRRRVGSALLATALLGPNGSQDSSSSSSSEAGDDVATDPEYGADLHTMAILVEEDEECTASYHEPSQAHRTHYIR